ncbi:hypothetical protein QVH35_08560 [Candidatus Nitrosotenuis chungbukensis]|uniref:hypothetical protein n=1 Tax=Candidatus Nitrosotenuis chungbukensis TaxID=1353246 RepID=UPI002673F2CB|nr:hypothetical protein [Candidatus Nitrosotenuis chungbukensis]WKT57437.1 hypothetical protein QVH35_08560 [Candidatus Nitrosotenuis chungbukensis]
MRILHVVILVIIGIIVTYYITSAFVLQQQAINKQSVYVHLLQDWRSHPGNIVYDITNVWSQTKEQTLRPEARLEMAKETSVDEVRSVHGKSYILVQHDNTDCHDVWEPHYARFGADVIRHQIEYLAGKQKSPDPNITMYTPVKSKQGDKEHEDELKTGFSQFIPICTSKDAASFDYSVRINDESVGFDVYFVPSISEQVNYDEQNAKFKHYGGMGCFGKNYVSFSGTCENVDENSGLLIVVPDTLSLPLTKLDVYLYEK